MPLAPLLPLPTREPRGVKYGTRELGAGGGLLRWIDGRLLCLFGVRRVPGAWCERVRQGWLVTWPPTPPHHTALLLPSPRHPVKRVVTTCLQSTHASARRTRRAARRTTVLPPATHRLGVWPRWAARRNGASHKNGLISVHPRIAEGDWPSISRTASGRRVDWLARGWRKGGARAALCVAPSDSSADRLA